MPVLADLNSAGAAEVRRLTTVYELLAALTHAKAVEDIYKAALDSLLTATAADRAAILTFDQDGVMRFQAWRDLSPEYREAVTGHTPWPKGTQNAQPIVIPDVLSDESLTAYRDLFVREQIRALAFIPLNLETGVSGKFMLYYAAAHECTQDELAVAQLIASHVALVLERKRADEALAQNEARLQTIVDNSATVIFLKDVQGRYLLVNRRFEDLFHVRKAEVIGKTDFDIFPAEIAARFQANDREVLASNEPLTMEEEAPHDDGMHTYLSNKVPIHNLDGEIAGVCGISTDITDRKKIEAASLLLAAIVESSEDAIVSKDLNGIITSWNKAAERTFGYTAEEAVGKPVAMLAAPERRDEMPEILNKIRRGERVEHYETLRCRKGGEVIHVSLTISPVRDASGRIIGASKIARDISDQKRVERERVLLLAREQEARKTAELLNRVGPMLAAELDTEKLVQSVTDIAKELVGAEFGSFAPTFQGEGVVRCEDVTRDPRYGKNAPHFGMPEGHLPVRSYLASPLVLRSGEVLGGLFFGHSTPGKFTAQHEAILTGLVAQAEADGRPPGGRTGLHGVRGSAAARQADRRSWPRLVLPVTGGGP